MKKIMAITRPIPTEYAERIYNGKTVFVGKSFPRQVSKGVKFVIYESHGERAYTGWADIKFMNELSPSTISKRYAKELMITSKELKEYAEKTPLLTVIELENFEKFKKPVKPKIFVSMRGKYIYEDEYQLIINNKD